MWSIIELLVAGPLLLGSELMIAFPVVAQVGYLLTLPSLVLEDLDWSCEISLAFEELLLIYFIQFAPRVTLNRYGFIVEVDVFIRALVQVDPRSVERVGLAANRECVLAISSLLPSSVEVRNVAILILGVVMHFGLLSLKR